eukprot:TRINITY_DN2880_c0_g1_i1.p1 TRINITY_DN2880_c0_g1~~TRINITY_DN2880_c0_g1_i1.p1  ORF type:complete len:311 (+),score=53.40 TRINITY_DN2880_c0_g1_i1:538-1470(+)
MQLLQGFKGVPQLVDWFEEKGRVFMVTELFGSSMAHVLRMMEHTGGASPDMARKLLQMLLECLNELHENGWVHGDLKMANMCWDPVRECCRLIDYGSTFQQSDQLHCQPMQTCGYEPPEVLHWNLAVKAGDARVPHRPGPAADVFGLGVVVAELVAGKQLGEEQAWVFAEEREDLLGRLLKHMLDPDPVARPSCGQALSFQFLNQTCDGASPDLECLADKMLFPTYRILLQNALSEDEDPQELEDVKADVMQECSKWGRVKQVWCEVGSRSITVEYLDLDSSCQARHDLMGREFGGRPLEAFFALKLFRY